MASEDSISSLTSGLGNWQPNETKDGQGKASTGRGRLLTPEATPEPNAARNQADDKRRQEEANLNREQVEDGFARTRAPDPSPDDDDTGNEDATDGQTDAITAVLKCGKDEHRKILGVEESYNDAYEEEAKILDAAWERGMQTHPNYNKNKDAGTAFKMILDAATALDVDEEQIEQIKYWDGPDDDDAEENTMDGVEKGIPTPHKLILQIYNEATPHLAQLQTNPRSKAAAKQLDILNDRIKKQNETDELSPTNQWVIRYEELSEEYQKAKPAIERLLKNPEDHEARSELESRSNALSHIINKHHYLNWNIDLDLAKSARPKPSLRKPTKEGPASPGSTGSNVKSPEPATQSKNEPSETRATSPGSTGSNVKSPEPATQSNGEPSETPASPLQSKVAQKISEIDPTLPQAVQKLQSETLAYWSKMGWDTYTTGDGDVILSYKALSREGKEPYAYEFTVMSRESPYFQIKLGSEIGRQEMDTYLAMSRAYKINTDPGDDKTPVYTYRDKARYMALLWTATKPRKQTRAGTKPRTGDTQCCVLWKDGTVSEMARAHFKKITTENEKKAIEKYCKSVGVLPPWEMDPKVLTVPVESTMGQQLLQAGRTGESINLGTGSLVTGTSKPATDGVVTSLQHSMATLQTNLQAMDSKFETSQKLMLEQLKKQQDLQSQMQQQLQQQQQQQMELQNALMKMLGQSSSTSPSSASK